MLAGGAGEERTRKALRMSRRICVLTELVEEGDPRSIKLRERLEHGGRGAECVGERDESRGDHGEQCRGGEDLHERE